MTVETLRCFVEHGGDGWIAYCVDADVEARGRTREEARHALDRALEHYCCERAPAFSQDDRKTISAVRWIKYSAARLIGHPEGAYSRQCYEFRSPPEPVAGLA
ncbi:MAG: hypothetical protein M3Z31_08335 [Pseudomonadota bacterium]|nr:hypothetical protein [Pseudomonadota bacterium]